MADSFSTSDEAPTVYVVDAIGSQLELTIRLLRRANIRAQGFCDSDTFLASFNVNTGGCLLFDRELPGMSGLELYNRVLVGGCDLPLIIAGANGCVQDVIQAMRGGALDYIERPFDPSTLVDRVLNGLAMDANWRRDRAVRARTDAMLATLTQREAEVMELIVAGRLTKQIAKTLEISPKTVEVHRSNLSKKLEVDSVARLVRLVVEHRAHNERYPFRIGAPYVLGKKRASEEC